MSALSTTLSPDFVRTVDVPRSVSRVFDASLRLSVWASIAEYDPRGGDWSVTLRDVGGDGPVAKSNDDAECWAVCRVPFRSALRRQFGTGDKVRSLRGRLFVVEGNADSFGVNGTPGLSPESNDLGFLGWGAAPHSVRRALVREIRDTYHEAVKTVAESGDELVVYAYLVYSYDTPIAWDVFAASRDESVADFAPRVWARDERVEFLGVAELRTRYDSVRKLRVPDIRYSQTTTQHQSGLGLAWAHVEPVPGSEGLHTFVPAVPHARDSVYVSTAERVDVGDPGQFRAGRGQSPFGPGGISSGGY